jgi:hypothetical protein
MAMGVPSMLVVATPPTLDSAGKSDSLIDVADSVPGDVIESPPSPHAAKAASASVAAL